MEEAGKRQFERGWEWRRQGKGNWKGCGNGEAGKMQLERSWEMRRQGKGSGKGGGNG